MQPPPGSSGSAGGQHFTPDSRKSAAASRPAWPRSSAATPLSARPFPPGIRPARAQERTAVSKYVLCCDKTAYRHGFEYWNET